MPLTPYYDHAGITIYHGDCLEYLSILEDHSIDAVICDPPYGTTICAWDTIIPFDLMWQHLKRLTKKRSPIVLFGSQPFTSHLVMSNIEWFKYMWHWDKNNGAGFCTAKFRPFIVTEDIAVFGDGAINYYPQMTKRLIPTKKKSASSKSELYHLTPIGNREYDTAYPKNILRFPKNNGNGTVHPTEKPIPLMRYLINTYTQEGDTILDFTCGSGPTLRAAKDLGRKAIGIEINERYCEIAATRLSQECLLYVE